MPEADAGHLHHARMHPAAAAATVAAAAAGEKVYLAVADDDSQCFHCALRTCVPLQQALVLVHIYQPAKMIPHMGTTLPASMVKGEIVSAYMERERSRIYKKLEEYAILCASAKIQAEVLVVEKEDVAVGLLELIAKYEIKTLILGAGKYRINGWMSKLAVTLQKRADPSCNILFLHSGNLISSRQQRIKIYTVGDNNISFPASCSFLSGCSNNTSSTSSSSFWDSHSTGGDFDAARLDDPSLDSNAASVFDANRFKPIDHELQCPLKEEGSRSVPAEHRAFHTKCCEIISRRPYSFPGAPYLSFDEANWKAMKSWPSELEYIVDILKTLSGPTNGDLSEVAKQALCGLLEFASMATKLRRPPDKLFRVLHMYRTLIHVSPTLLRMFPAEFVTTEAKRIRSALKNTAKGIILELKILIQTYGSEKFPEGGSIHLITRYLMKYIRLLINHTGSLDTILYRGHSNGDNLLVADGRSSTGRLISGLISDLDSMLQEKSKLHASEGLQCIFLMNNAHFILQEFEQSKTWLLLGYEWIEKRRHGMVQYKMQYRGASWAPIVSHLEIPISPFRKRIRTSNPLNFFYPTDPLKKFESSFKETCETQMHWKVPDPLLRAELHNIISVYVLQAYHAYLDSLKQSARFAAEKLELEAMLVEQIGELFEG